MWASFRTLIFRTLILTSGLVIALCVTSHAFANQVVSFLVLGSIPGTGISLSYTQCALLPMTFLLLLAGIWSMQKLRQRHNA